MYIERDIKRGKKKEKQREREREEFILELLNQKCTLIARYRNASSTKRMNMKYRKKNKMEKLSKYEVALNFPLFK